MSTWINRTVSWLTADEPVIRPKPVRAPIPARAFSIAALERAFLKVRANAGGPGGDNLTIETFDRNRAERLAELSTALISGTYKPGPYRHLAIPKIGGKRPLAIPSVVDRVAQTAWLFALTPALDARMQKSSYAYRPRRGVQDALTEARRLIAEGRPWIVSVDIERYFETVPHETLLRDLDDWIAERRMNRLVWLWLKAASTCGRGLAQGSPISPVLANIHLDPIDRAMERSGHRFVRYADDMVAFARSAAEGEAIRRQLCTALTARGLRASAEKSRVAHARLGVEFLGETLVQHPARFRSLLRKVFSLRRNSIKAERRAEAAISGTK